APLGKQLLDVRMVQSLANLQLALIAAVRGWITNQAAEGDLQHQQPTRLAVTRLVGVAHAALAESLQNLVFVVYGLAGRVLHGATLSCVALPQQRSAALKNSRKPTIASHGGLAVRGWQVEH